MRFLSGFAVCLIFIVACNATFPHRWYGLDCKHCDGTLLGPEPKDDNPLTECLPDDQGKGTCAVLKFTDMDRLRLDYLEMAEKLKHCRPSAEN